MLGSYVHHKPKVASTECPFCTWQSTWNWNAVTLAQKNKTTIKFKICLWKLIVNIHSQFIFKQSFRRWVVVTVSVGFKTSFCDLSLGWASTRLRKCYLSLNFNVTPYGKKTNCFHSFRCFKNVHLNCDETSFSQNLWFYLLQNSFVAATAKFLDAALSRLDFLYPHIFKHGNKNKYSQ